MRTTLVMPPGSFRFWTVLLGACAAAGCVRNADPRIDLAERTAAAAQRLEALGPRLARTGVTADAAVATIGEIRKDIAALPPPPEPEPAIRPSEPLPVVAADGDRWRLGLGAEVMAVRLRIRGDGNELTDVGPLMPGVAAGASRLVPFDRHGGIRLGLEAATAWQIRQERQHLGIVALRPIVELAIADITLRPMAEIGQPFVNLGADPGAITRADASWAFGGRLGIRLGDALVQVGWRRFSFIGHSEQNSYRIDGEGPEAALRWSF